MNAILKALIRSIQVVLFLAGAAYPIWMFYLMFTDRLAWWLFGMLVLIPVVPVIPFACALALEEVVKKFSK